jgi:hypothetical protein
MENKKKPVLFKMEHPCTGEGKAKRMDRIIHNGGTAYVYLPKEEFDIHEDMVFKFFKDKDGELRCYRRLSGEKDVELKQGSDDGLMAYNNGEPITEDEYYGF